MVGGTEVVYDGIGGRGGWSLGVVCHETTPTVESLDPVLEDGEYPLEQMNADASWRHTAATSKHV